MYVGFKSLLQLTEYQKKVIDNGIRLQRAMWNYLVAEKNQLVLNKTIKIQTSTSALEKELRQVFFEEFKNSGLGTRMVRSIATNYVRAWENHYNKNMKNQGIPVTHSGRLVEQTLLFFGCENHVYGGLYQLPTWKKGARGFENETNPVPITAVRLKVVEKPEEVLKSYTNLQAKETVITRRRDKYFISINYDAVPISKKSKEGEIGLDWGLVDYFIDSNGQKHNIPKSAERQLQRIKTLNRVLSKKQKGSNNYFKVVNKISNAWYKYTCIKRDFVQKFTTQLCRENKLIVIEDLDLMEMREKTHKTRRRKMNYNSFYLFKETLKYKIASYDNCTLIKVDKYFPSSQLCSICGEKTGKKPVSIREFTCPYCGTRHDRDINAAINILNEGKRMLAKG